MKRLIAALSLAAFLATAPAGCGTIIGQNVIPVITKVLTVIMDAQQIVTAVDQAAQTWFTLNPGTEYEEKYQRAIGQVNASLTALIRVTQGTTKLHAEQVDAAFDDFKAAYQHLIGLLGAAGVLLPNQNGLLMAPRGGQTFPEPLALTFRLGADE